MFQVVVEAPGGDMEFGQSPGICPDIEHVSFLVIADALQVIVGRSVLVFRNKIVECLCFPIQPV